MLSVGVVGVSSVFGVLFCVKEGAIRRWRDEEKVISCETDSTINPFVIRHLLTARDCS